MTDIIGIYIPAGAHPCRIVKLPREGFNEAVYQLLNIDCYDIVRLPRDDHTIMLVDDEGLLRDSPYNARASILSRYPCGLVGDALVVGVGTVDDGEQDVVGLDPHRACNLITALEFGEEIRRATRGAGYDD